MKLWTHPSPSLTAALVVLCAAVAIPTYSANPPVLSIGDLVWLDVNGDGQRQADEPGMANVGVSLYADNGDGIFDWRDQNLMGTGTDAQGRYQFSGLPAGNYYVRVEGWNFTSGQALFGLASSPGQTEANNGVDDDDNGVDNAFPSQQGVASSLVTLQASTTGTQALDFGFIPVSPVMSPLVQGPSRHQYQSVMLPGISWDAARGMAAALTYKGVKGHLVTFSGLEEDLFVEVLRQGAVAGAELFGQEFWAGGFQQTSQADSASGWVWLNGEGAIPGLNGGAAYSNWLGSEPNDCCDAIENGSENHLAIGLGGQFGWNDEGNLHNILGFIVEFDALPDRDGDGFADAVDPCPDSNLSPTVVLGGIDSGAPNTFVSDGCTLADRILSAQSGARNHGEFVKTVTVLVNELRQSGKLAARDASRVISTAGRAKIP